MADERKFDCIVVGLGSMGSATAYYLAKRGKRVLGLEQFEISHDQGSHAGQSRIIRKAYFEHPDYVPLLDRAYSNWRELEALTGAEIYVKTGLLYLGRPDTVVMNGVRKAAHEYQIPVESLDRQDAAKRYPQFKIPSDFEVLMEPDAGFVTPERAILSYAQAAIHYGATLRTRERILEWHDKGSHVEVITSSGKYEAGNIVFTAGAWTSKLLPLKTPLKVTRQTVAWMNPPSHASFSLGQFPCWFVEDPGKGSFYGFPILPVAKFGGPVGLKLALHVPQLESDPDKVDRTPSAVHVAELRKALQDYIPGGDGEPLAVRTCLYTNSADEHFILDLLPGTGGKVSIACGFSGHGFKFASVIGEIMADFAMHGKTPLPAGFLGLSRF